MKIMHQRFGLAKTGRSAKRAKTVAEIIPGFAAAGRQVVVAPDR
jgi:hypothetical protein